MSGLKPIKVWTYGQGPNPLKVLIALEELNIPYESIAIENPKAASFTKINPNGRLPAIQDPNNGDLILWESGAILEYLVESYDKAHKLTSTAGQDKWLLKQYLHFQMSGQGPYFGQAVWFRKFHPEDLPSAKKRYDEQVVRVFGVLDAILEGKQYLVGDKFTYADLAFIPWDSIAHGFLTDVWTEHEVDKKYPNFVAWHKRITERDSVKKVYGL
ncbi:Glutathione transferase [Purpureocillium takamizusanense]|uniref:glutathione transferase n=1 Tax=Purpureocillium takamizusanense TaxID=2060973 RepID=A0A9Q8Q5P3_9HYPO|nr:Glutathione transferase [Purpureocillium takamizusanense]UNI13515.1 Glutathione transferase [Purpureocillium takamizusanense]